MTTIDVAGEYGGIDAHQAMLSHFPALKSACKGRSFEGFPFFELTFILRVDGEIQAFGLSGPGSICFGRRGQSVSVDIVISREEWRGRAASEVATFICGAILDSVSLLRERGGRRCADTDWAALQTALDDFCAVYLAELSTREQQG